MAGWPTCGSGYVHERRTPDWSRTRPRPRGSAPVEAAWPLAVRVTDLSVGGAAIEILFTKVTDVRVQTAGIGRHLGPGFLGREPA
jgi:hypothetical protein